MSISDAEFARWSRADGVQRVVLCEMSCYTNNAADIAAYEAITGPVPSAGEDGLLPVVRFLATYLYTTGPADSPANCCYVDRLLAAPSMRRSIDEFLDVGELVVLNPDGAYDHWIDDIWTGCNVVLRIGDPSWALGDFRALLTGTIDKLLSATSDRLTFAIRDRMELLNGPVQTNMLEDGPREGQPIPLCLGKCDNISPVFLGLADVLVANITAVVMAWDVATATISSYATGGPFVVGDTFVLAGAPDDWLNRDWVVTAVRAGEIDFNTGIPHPDYTATATMTGTIKAYTYQYHDGPTGGVRGVRDNGVSILFEDDAANGKFVVKAMPIGSVTADVYGAYKEVDDYYAWPAECIKWLVGRAGHSALVDAASFAAFDAAHQAIISLYMPDRRNLVETIREIAAAVGAHLYISRAGLLRIWQLRGLTGGDTPVDSILPAHQVAGTFAITRFDTPVARYRMGFNRNWTPQPEDGLAGSVTPYFRQYYAREWFSIYDSGPTATSGLQPDIVDTVLYLGSSEGFRRATLLAAAHKVYSVQLYGVLAAVELGDAVWLQHPRFGLGSARKVRVVGIYEDAGRVTLECWE
jgi:hypothetical protein